MQKIVGSLSSIEGVYGNISSTDGVYGNISAPAIIECEKFYGPFEYTPSAETQEINIMGLQSKQNIIIGPIPSNYGLITWDGVTLTVS